MSLRDDVNWFAVVAYATGGLGFVVFIALYAQTRFFLRSLGVWLMALSLSLLINTGCALSVILLGEYPGVKWVRILGAVTYAPAGWLLLRYWRDVRRHQPTVGG